MPSNIHVAVAHLQTALRAAADHEQAQGMQARELSGLSYRETTKHIEELVR